MFVKPRPNYINKCQQKPIQTNIHRINEHPLKRTLSRGHEQFNKNVYLSLCIYFYPTWSGHLLKTRAKLNLLKLFW